MTRPQPWLKTVRARWERGPRRERALAIRGLREALVSMVGLLGRPVRNQRGQEFGRLADIVARFADSDPYPPISGLVVGIGRGRYWIPASQLAEVRHTEAVLSSAQVDLQDFNERPGEVLLAKDILDHQLVDVEGRRVIRAADLCLAPLRGEVRLVGVDVSVQSLLRRLGPARLRTRPTPARVIDWAEIQTIGEVGGRPGELQLRERTSALRALRPGEIADLLEELGRQQREQLLDQLDTATAADVIEELPPEDVETVLRDATPERAAALVAEMEPDEAVDALRDMTEDERRRVLAQLPAATTSPLLRSLGYAEDRAGGIMTTVLVTVREGDTVEEVRQRLREARGHEVDLDGVEVVDDQGRLIDVISVLELFLAEGEDPVRNLVGPPWPVTVGVDATVDQVAEQLLDNRTTSVVVVDDEGRPLGRVLADDIIDALTPERGRLHIFRLAPQ